jgi:predicted dienelactone hydrolase
MRFPALVVVLLTAIAGVADAGERQLQIAGLSVTTWSSDAAPGPQPVIVFSHGLHGCATQSRFLMEALATAGYLVFAPNHRDAACGGRGSRGRSGSGSITAPLGKPGQWTSATYRDRADDITRLIDALRGDDRFRTRADWRRLGLAGHSLGGYTVLGLGGAWPDWTLAGVKAILALSPYSQPFESQHTLAGVSVPVMYQGGTRDVGITPWLRKTQGTYDQTPAPKYFVEFNAAGHFAWTNLTTTSHDSIAAYSVAFLNHYVKGQAPDPVLIQARADVTQLRYASELGLSGTGKANGRGGAPAQALGRRRR